MSTRRSSSVRLVHRVAVASIIPLGISCGGDADCSPTDPSCSTDAQVQVAALSAVPSQPSGVTATALDVVRIQLNWSDNSANETSFRIERSDMGGPFTEVRRVGADEVLMVDTFWGRTDTDFTYRVRACNDAGCSSYSDPASASILGPPIIKFHPPSLHFSVLRGEQPPPADLWAVNLGNTAPDAFYLGHVDAGFGVSLTEEEGSLEPGDSLRIHVRSSVGDGNVPVLHPAYILYEVKVGDLLHFVETLVTVDLFGPLVMSAAGGTIDGSWGTILVWNSFAGRPAFYGPQGWDPIGFEEYRVPKGVPPHTWYAMSDEATPVSGSYQAVTDNPPFFWIGRFDIDATRQLPAPTDLTAALTDGLMVVRWTNRPEHRSTLVRVSSPTYDVFHDEVVGPGVTEFTVPIALRTGHLHELEVIALSADLTDYRLFVDHPALQIDAARAVLFTSPTTGPPIIEFRPASVALSVPGGVQPPPADLWAVNLGGSAPDTFFLSDVETDGVQVEVSYGEGSLSPGDSLRVHIVSSVQAPYIIGLPTSLNFAYGFEGRSYDVTAKVDVTITTPLHIPMAGGTIDENWGTFFVWDTYQPLDPDPPACCPNPVTTVVGPPGWNFDQPLDLEPNQAKGMAGTLAYAMTDEGVPQGLAWYNVAVPELWRTSDFRIDADRWVPPPGRVNPIVRKDRLTVQWSRAPEHASTLVRITSPTLGFFYDEVVRATGPSLHTLNIPIAGVAGHRYTFEVIGLSEDLTDPNLIPGYTTYQIDAGRSVGFAVLTDPG